MSRRRTPAQVEADEAFRADAIARAAKIMESHADHPHYHGLCVHYVDDNHLTRPIFMSDTSPYSSREHHLAYIIKKLAELPPKPRARAQTTPHEKRGT